MPRTIAVFTSTRADAEPLRPVLAALQASPDVELVVVASGTHLDRERGHTLDTLSDFAPALEIVDLELADDDPTSLIASFGPLGRGVADAMRSRSVDVLLVLGDRWELLPAVGAALLLQVPVAHLHGGEVTEGALDERIRHAVTKLADLHLCTADVYRRRILQLGEETWRVHVTGAPSLDRFADVRPEDPASFGQRIDVPLEAPWGLVTYHPPTVERTQVAQRARTVFEAAADRLASIVITYPGHDPGGKAVIEEIERIRSERSHVHAVPYLGSAYPVALASADVMVGNSSSGIIEAASFQLPVVNVGDRQLGRIAPDNVVTCDEDRGSIDAALDRALDPGFRAGLEGLVNPYGDGHAASRIVDVLRDAPLDRLHRKRFVDQGAVQ